MDSVSMTIPNFTQIQQPCETLQEWQYGRAFQEILKEVGSYMQLYNFMPYVMYRDLAVKN